MKLNQVITQTKFFFPCDEIENKSVHDIFNIFYYSIFYTLEQ
jgi:hypothetical protein